VQEPYEIHGSSSVDVERCRVDAMSVRNDPGNAEGRPSGGLREVLRTRSQWAAG